MSGLPLLFDPLQILLCQNPNSDDETQDKLRMLCLMRRCSESPWSPVRH